jgi:hypothetical protein
MTGPVVGNTANSTECPYGKFTWYNNKLEEFCRFCPKGKTTASGSTKRCNQHTESQQARIDERHKEAKERTSKQYMKLNAGHFKGKALNWAESDLSMAVAHSAQKKCMLGYYKVKWGNEPHSCKVCPMGKFSSYYGIMMKGCAMCPDGKWNERAGQGGCQRRGAYWCTPGHYRLPGDMMPFLSCRKCPVGKYSAHRRPNACKSCPIGQNSTMKGMTRCWNVTRAPTPAPPTPAPDTGGTVAPKPTPQPTPQDEGFPSNYKKKVCHASRCSGGGGDIPPVIDAVAHEPYHKCGYDRKWKKCVCWCWYPPQTKMEREDRDDDHD